VKNPRERLKNPQKSTKSLNPQNGNSAVAVTDAQQVTLQSV